MKSAQACGASIADTVTMMASGITAMARLRRSVSAATNIGSGVSLTDVATAATDPRMRDAADQGQSDADRQPAAHVPAEDGVLERVEREAEPDREQHAVNVRDERPA